MYHILNPISIELDNVDNTGCVLRGSKCVEHGRLQETVKRVREKEWTNFSIQWIVSAVETGILFCILL